MTEKNEETRTLSRPKARWRSEMRTPEDVAAMLRLHAMGWGSKRIARELGVSRNTVRRYLKQGGYEPYKKPDRKRALDGLGPWLREHFLKHGGNADVVRQELLTEKKIDVSLRTVERAVRPYRRELTALAKATVRFETAPGQQLQIDFGTITVLIAGLMTKVKLFVATLGFSRRIFVAAFDHERQSAWFDGLEGAFQHFGGVPTEVLLDNPRALVHRHDVVTREVVFHRSLIAFAGHWRFQPVACAPYRARTKGKDERAVQYVKRNAVAGREFDSWASFEAHLTHWNRTIADERVHGTTGERPRARFERAEASALQSLDGRPPFSEARELNRVVQNDLTVEVDTNHYSVPLRLIGESVTVQIRDGLVEIFHAGKRVARHPHSRGRRQRVTDRAHYDGVVAGAARQALGPSSSELARPLDVYAQLVEEAS